MNDLEEKAKQQAEALKDGEEYQALEFMTSQLAYLYKTSREEETTTKEKVQLSLAMVSIYENICRF